MIEAGASHLVCEVISSADGNVTVSALDGGKTVSTATTAVTAGTATRLTVSDLASNRTYTLSAVAQSTSGELSAARTASGKTTTPFTFAVENKTDTTLTVKIQTNCKGTLDITYTARKTGKKETRVTGLLLEKDTKRDFVISDLTPSTEYDVTATFTDLLDGSYTASDRVTTAAAQKEVLEITGLTLVSSTGDTYEADVKDGKATLTIEKAEYITLKGSSSVANAKFTFNGETVNPDTASGKITVTPGEDTIVAVTLTSGVTGTVVDATLTVSVRK